MAKNQQQIPDFPGLGISRKPPAPPKFLEVEGEGGKKELIRVAERKKVEPVKMTKPGPSTTPLVSAHISNSTPIKNYDGQPHQYDVIPHQFKGKVNSSSDMKGVQPDMNKVKIVPPEYIGSSYKQYVPPPKEPTIPRPYVGNSASEFKEGPLLNNRMPDGQILGSLQKRFADPEHVPHLKAEIPLGPDNKYKKLNDEWSAYYDDEAGAVYYYNEISGEATWIKPKIEKQKSVSAANYI